MELVFAVERRSSCEEVVVECEGVDSEGGLYVRGNLSDPHGRIICDG